MKYSSFAFAISASITAENFFFGDMAMTIAANNLTELARQKLPQEWLQTIDLILFSAATGALAPDNAEQLVISILSSFGLRNNIIGYLHLCHRRNEAEHTLNIIKSAHPMTYDEMFPDYYDKEKLCLEMIESLNKWNEQEFVEKSIVLFCENDARWGMAAAKECVYFYIPELCDWNYLDCYT